MFGKKKFLIKTLSRLPDQVSIQLLLIPLLIKWVGFLVEFVVMPESAGIVALPCEVVIHADRKDSGLARPHFRILKSLPVKVEDPDL